MEIFGGFSSFVWQRGILQLIAIHLITLHNILEYMLIAIIQNEAADFVKINICVILQTFGHDCTTSLCLFIMLYFNCVDYYCIQHSGLHRTKAEAKKNVFIELLLIRITPVEPRAVH